MRPRDGGDRAEAGQVAQQPQAPDVEHQGSLRFCSEM
jgi:hypothetical protein